MDTIASQITSLTIVYSTVNSDADQKKYQSSAETGEFPAPMASNAENVSIWWRHYVNDIRHIIHTLGMFVQLISLCKCNHYLAEFINSFPLDKMSTALADDILKGIFMNWNLCILIRISLKFVPEGPIDNNQHWFRLWLGAEQATSHYLNKCLPSSLTHICGTRGIWVKDVASNQTLIL